MPPPPSSLDIPPPASHVLGKHAEQRAAIYLQQQGFHILAHNYTYQKAEIDLIAQQDGLLIFVEVKARTRRSWGYPEEFVTPKQQQGIQKAATHYVMQQAWQGHIRFDVIALTKIQGTWQLTHLPDAFY